MQRRLGIFWNMQSMRYAILMTVICPSMSSPVALQLDGVNEFVSSVTERIFYDRVAECKNDFRELRTSTHWISVLFFCLYMSYRSLYE